MDAAARLFRERGYGPVGIDDIGRAVGVTGTALYRHFESKEDLLMEALKRAVADVAETTNPRGGPLAGPPDSEEAMRRWVAGVIANWDYVLIYHREANALSPARRQELRSFSRPAFRAIQEAVTRVEFEPGSPQYRMRELMVIGCVNGILRHGDSSHRLRYEPCLIRILLRLNSILSSPPLSRRNPGLRPSSQQRRASTREQLLSSAVEQFARCGYASVGIEDVGRGAGMSGPAIYRHFDNKEAILREAILRFDGAINAMLSVVLSMALEPDQVLQALTKLLVELTYVCPDLAYVYFTQSHYLSAVDRPTVGHRPLLFEEWDLLLRLARPELDKWASRTAIYAATGAITDIAADMRMRDFDYRIPLLHLLGGIIDETCEPEPAP